MLCNQNGLVAIRGVSGSPSMSTSIKPLGLAVALILAGCNQAAAPADSASAAAMADAAAAETMAEDPAAETATEPATEATAVPAPNLQAAVDRKRGAEGKGGSVSASIGRLRINKK